MKRVCGAMALCAVLLACSPDETDFREEAEKTAVEIAESENPGFTATASCEQPSSSDVGTTFNCTVTFDDGEEITLPAEIISDDTVAVG